MKYIDHSTALRRYGYFTDVSEEPCLLQGTDPERGGNTTWKQEAPSSSETPVISYNLDRLLYSE
jgi:hypothetical protein